MPLSGIVGRHDDASGAMLSLLQATATGRRREKLNFLRQPPRRENLGTNLLPAHLGKAETMTTHRPHPPPHLTTVEHGANKRDRAERR